MSNNQLALLSTLRNILNEMSDECTNDPEYNELISSMKMFNCSLDELVDTIDFILE